MATDPANAPVASDTEAPERAAKRWIGFACGLILMAGAGVALFNARDDFAAALLAMRGASWWQWAALPATMLASLVLTSSVFWLFMRRVGRVRLDEMNALIGTAWVMNYLPMHPGMFGRFAYHKKVNGIDVKDSLRVTIVANVLTLVCVGVMPALAYAVSAGMGAAPAAQFALLQLPLALCAATALLVRTTGTGSPHIWWALAIRLAEFQLWAARYWLSFAVIGVPIPYAASVVLAGAVIVASMVAITGNGLGVQEWAVALVLPLLPAGLVMADLGNADGLIGAFLSRAFEVAVAIPCGAWGAWWVSRHTRRLRDEPVETVDPESGSGEG